MLAVFLPLTLVKGMAGLMFKQLGWITSIIMIVSTIGALTLIPMLCSQYLRYKPKKSKLNALIFGNFSKFIDWISAGYSRLINWCIGHRTIVTLVSLGVFGATIGIFGPIVKTEFFPKSDDGRITVQLELPAGTGQSVTRGLAHELHGKFAAAIPEITNCSYAFGQADSDNAFASMQNNGTHVVSFNVNIGSMENRERSTGQVADVIREILKDYPEFKKVKVTEGASMGMGGASTVDIEIYGYDFHTTDLVAREIQAKMLAAGGSAQVLLSRDEYTPEYQVDFDREKLAVNGLNSTTAAAYLTSAMNGSTQSYYREDGDEYDIRVRYDRKFRESLDDIENITIYNQMGQGIKIRDVGVVKEASTPPTITRKNRERYVTVSGVVASGYALSDIVEEAKVKMAEVNMPAGFMWQIGGTYEDQQETFGDLILLMVLMVVLVFVIMASQFESLTYPFVIMFSLPFAVVGVIIGLAITGTPLNIMSLLGILMLIGIVVNNGIVLVDYTILCRERGMNVLDAVVTSGRSRLRPILMTTLTTVLGMIPMAVGSGVGAEMWNSLGMSVAWGLSFSTLITLILIPTLFASFAIRGEKRREKQMRKLQQQN